MAADLINCGHSIVVCIGSDKAHAVISVRSSDENLDNLLVPWTRLEPIEAAL
jgi:hypothetical protein